MGSPAVSDPLAPVGLPRAQPEFSLVQAGAISPAPPDAPGLAGCPDQQELRPPTVLPVALYGGVLALHVNEPVIWL